MSNTLISDNGGNGIQGFPSGTGTVSGILDHVKTQNNVGCGIKVVTNSQTMNFTISDSVSANNGQIGVFTNATGGTLNVMVRNSTIANNSDSGLRADNGGVTMRVTRSTITGNATGWVANTGAVLSYGDNNIDGNGAANTEPPNPLVYH